MKNTETSDVYSVRPKCVEIDLAPRVLPPVQHKANSRLRVTEMGEKKRNRHASLSIGSDDLVLTKKAIEKAAMRKTGSFLIGELVSDQFRAEQNTHLIKKFRLQKLKQQSIDSKSSIEPVLKRPKLKRHFRKAANKLIEMAMQDNVLQLSSLGKPTKEKAVVTQYMVHKRLSSDASRKKMSRSLLQLLDKTDFNELVNGEYDSLDQQLGEMKPRQRREISREIL